MKSILLITCYTILSTTAMSQADQKQNFAEESDALKWRSVNDSVMGGLSKGSSYETEAGHRMFQGEISLKNNGGFSSIRSFGGKYDLSKYTGMEIIIRGDGRKYYFTSRSGGSRRLAFWSPVQPKAAEWETIKVPFSSFYATSFGRTIPGMKLNLKMINSFGFMLYDKNDGAFSLEIKSIRPY